MRSLFVAFVVTCACGTSNNTRPDAGDGAADDSATGTDGQRLDLPIEVNCADCGGICGDGVLRVGEQCDDGNRAGGDGCTALCQLEPGWTCPVPGMACQRSD